MVVLHAPWRTWSTNTNADRVYDGYSGVATVSDAPHD